EQRLHSPRVLRWHRPADRPVVIAAAGRYAGDIEQVLGGKGEPAQRPASPALDPHAGAGHEGAEVFGHGETLFGRLVCLLVALAAEEAELTELHAEQPVEPDVNDRSDEQREQLRNHEAADHADA